MVSPSTRITSLLTPLSCPGEPGPRLMTMRVGVVGQPLTSIRRCGQTQSSVEFAVHGKSCCTSSPRTVRDCRVKLS